MLSITVRILAGLCSLRPVTGGVPLPQGAAPAGTVFTLSDEQGKPVPLQTVVLARWKDQSARWLLLDFQTQPIDARPERRYTLTWKRPTGGGPPTQEPGQEEKGEPSTQPSGPPGTAYLTLGSTRFAQAEEGLLDISGRLGVDLVLTDAQGNLWPAKAESVRIEPAGGLRSTLMMVGSFRRPDGARGFQFRLRASAYAGLGLVRLEPLILVDPAGGIMQHLRELKLSLRPRDGVKTARIGGDPEWKGSPSAGVRLFQYDDRNYRFEGADGKGGKAPGWAEFDDGKGIAAVALREFWQQWPKAIEATPKELAVALLPRFEQGDFDHMKPEHKYQYLFEKGCYRIRTGQARRWDIWLDLRGAGAPLGPFANAPFMPIADPAAAIATGVWDAIMPAGIPEMAEYDPWAQNIFNAYVHSIESQRDYGAMNWGDWYGERVVNWGNNEYDTAAQHLLQFARTGDPKYFYAAEAAARHSSEVDTVHFINNDLVRLLGQSADFPARPGLVHQHTVAHVSGFYPPEYVRKLLVEAKIGDGVNPYLCLDPYNLGHLWTIGMARMSLLTGDPFLKETVQQIGDNLASLAEGRKYHFMGHSHCGRTTGWSLLALSGAYELDLNERYLKAMKLLVDDALAEQDPHCGGWLYKLPPGHCECVKNKHVGMAGFITAILVNGLSRYYLLTGDTRLPPAINRAVTFLNRDTWMEQYRDWRYTSCPATSPIGHAGVIVMANVNAARIAKNPEHLRILRIAWDAKFQRLLKSASSQTGNGKAYTSTMYGCSETVGLLAQSRKGQ